jgi:lipopolysaccharide/colanic/teichoic acid biosynthesis glycosyltransferase
MIFNFAGVGDNPIPEPSTPALLVIAVGVSLFQFAQRRYNALQRLSDIVISSVALLVTAPVMLLLAIIIKLDSPGPVLYQQVRVGLNRRSRDRRKEQRASLDNDYRTDNTLGAPFTIYKLRTMRSDAEQGTGAVWAQKNDARITRIGKFLRKTRLDEIPQFINVLKGDMSFIGPRPERPEFVKKLNESIPSYYRRFEIPPGITGLAQTHDAYAADIKQTRRKLKYDLLYVKKKCLTGDIRIFFNTISTVVLGKGAR